MMLCGWVDGKVTRPRGKQWQSTRGIQLNSTQVYFRHHRPIEKTYYIKRRGKTHKTLHRTTRLSLTNEKMHQTIVTCNKDTIGNCMTISNYSVQTRKRQF